MQRRKFAVCGYSLAALALWAGLAFGQQGNTLTMRVNGAPAGGCAPIMFAVDNLTGNLYSCDGTGTWVFIGPAVGGITGTGVANQVAYFTAAQVIAGDTGLTYNATTDTLTVGVGGVTTNGISGLINLPCSATTPAAAGDVRCVTGTPNTLQVHDGTSAHILNQPGIKSIWIDTPVVADSGRIQVMFPIAVTITRIACSTKTANSTVDLNMEERVAATPDTAGTDVLSAELVCDTDQQTSCAAGCDVNTITNSGIAARVPLAMTPSAIANAPTDLRIFIEYY